MADRKKAKRLAKERMKCNKPKRTPGHATKSHVVKACKDGEEKIIRFGQQGVKGAGKNPKTAKEKARKASYYARHNAQDSKPDKMSARYWSHKVKWWPSHREMPIFLSFLTFFTVAYLSGILFLVQAKTERSRRRKRRNRNNWPFI